MSDQFDPEVISVEREMLSLENQLRAIRGEPALEQLPQPPFCSFCGRAKNEAGALVVGSAGPDHVAHICQRCAAEAHRLLIKG